MRRISTIASGWWDYTTLERDILEEAARLTAEDLERLARPGFEIAMYDSREEFFTAEALEYVNAWRRSTADAPVGVCGPIGPTEQLPLVARIVNDLDMDLRDCHFWGMDEWVVNGKSVSPDNPLSFARADMELCFNRIRPELRMPPGHLHFPSTEALQAYSASYDTVRCALMQGGQGEVKHWAFNDPFKREKPYADAPPSAQEFLNLPARVVDLHPLTIIQNARTSSGGIVTDIPSQAISVGPKETWKADMVSIWHPGWHDNPFGMRLTTLMISKGIADAAVPMSMLALHPHVRFSFLRSGIGSCMVEMH
jgi:glucosamine-6-phosphate deaminase